MSFSSGAAAAMATTTGEYKANDKCRKFIIILIYMEGRGKIFMNPLGKKKVCKHHKWKILLSEGLMLWYVELH